MMNPAIEIHGLGKQYTITNHEPYLSLRDSIAGFTKNIAGKGIKKENFWALRDINLQVEPGERIGIIGRNGAGKSTLLKIISRITPPTTGHAIIRGRVGSLLEVGTGFHPELSGMENIYLNGSILGLKKADITRQLDAIIDFSGIEKFISTPLKHYSTGMQLRLAFSVAAHLEPEILLIDEVLAVGDAEFQKKCLGKMEEVSKKEGRTILFVSHDLNAISQLTETCVFLERGYIQSFGNTPQILTEYQNRSDRNFIIIPSNKSSGPYISDIYLISSKNNGIQEHGKNLKVNFEVVIPEKTNDISLSFQILNDKMQPILHFWVVDGMKISFKEKGKYTLECEIPELNLYQGKYSISAYLGENKGKEKFDEIHDVAQFEVVMHGQDPGHSFGWQANTCIYREKHNWSIK